MDELFIVLIVLLVLTNMVRFHIFMIVLDRKSFVGLDVLVMLDGIMTVNIVVFIVVIIIIVVLVFIVIVVNDQKCLR